MPARNLTYRPAAQSPAAARPSPDGGGRAMSPATHYSLFIVHYSLFTRFAPCAITCRAFSPRKFADNETTRVAPFTHLHIGSFANYSLFTIHYSLGLSVDPMSDKYPSLSPYVYCADNPVKLVDPNGEEVEYDSFMDRIIVGLARIFNLEFRSHFKELKASEETYVFRRNSDGESDFTTDGGKLYINYSLTENAKKDGETAFSLMRHEATHAVQFEHGQLGFEYRDETNPILIDALKQFGFDESRIRIGKWYPINYDLNDEYEAHNNMHHSLFHGYSVGTSGSVWLYNCYEKIEEKNWANLSQAPAYRTLSQRMLNNQVKERVCDKYVFARPYLPR